MTLSLLAANLLVVVLGLFIAVQAFRGYRRHASTMMLAIGVGFVFLSLGGAMGCSTLGALGISVPGAAVLKTCFFGAGMGVISLAMVR